MLGRRFFSCPRGNCFLLPTTATYYRSGRLSFHTLIKAVASSRLHSELAHLSTLSITWPASLNLAKPNSLSVRYAPFNMSQRRGKSSQATNGSAKALATPGEEHAPSREHEHEHDHEHEDHSHSIFSGHSHSHGDDGHSHGQEKIMEALQGSGEL